jgi:hypothetical protein
LLYQLSYFGISILELEIADFEIYWLSIPKSFFPKFPNTKNFPFFGTAKVMENFIQQNFEMKFFRQFSTGYAIPEPLAATMVSGACFSQGFRVRTER